MDLISETAGVFAFLRDLYELLPVAIKLLILGSFGGIIYLSVMKSIWR